MTLSGGLSQAASGRTETLASKPTEGLLHIA